MTSPPLERKKSEYSDLRVFSFRRVMSVIIIVTLIIAALVSIFISYSNTDSYLQHEFTRQVSSSEEYLNSSTMYIFRGLKLWDSTYDPVMKFIAEETARSYISQGRNASAINLRDLANNVSTPFQGRVRIDLINESGVVKYSYGGVVGLDFSEWGFFYDDLTRIREGNEFVPDRVVEGFNVSAPATKYAYLPTDDHKFVIEPALTVGEDQLQERLNLSYLSLIDRVKEHNVDLADIAIYNSMKKLVISTTDQDNPLTYPWTHQYIKDTYKDKISRDTWDPANKTYILYKYLVIGEDNSPSAKYMDLVAEMVFSTERVENQRSANLILHIILAMVALVLVLIIGYSISQSLTRPIQEILDDINDISTGILTHTVRKTSHLELNRIADAINQMVTQIQKNLRTIQISESRYFGLFHSSAHAVIILEGKRVANMNRAASELFNVAQATILGRDITTLFENMGILIGEMIDSSDKGGTDSYIERFISFQSDSEEKFLNIRLTQVHTSDGGINQVQIQDITDQRKAYAAFAEQEALRKAYADLQHILELLPDPTFIIDTNGTVILWNEAMTNMFGISSKEMLGKGNYEYAVPIYGSRRKMLIDYALHPEDIDQVTPMEIEQVGDLLTTHTWYEHDRKRQYISAIASRLYNSEGKLIGAIESVRDITMIRKTQDALSVANKKINLLSKISRHDILNQVTILSGLSYLLSLDIQDPTMKDMISRMRNTVQVIQTQINFTREYQEIGSSEAIWINPVEGFLRQQSLFSGVDIEFLAEPSDLEIFTDPLFDKVLYNLIDNSMRHGEHVSKICLSVETQEDCAHIIYEDNGIGVVDEDKLRIFDQDYGKNTGHGLFLIREILSITEITIEENGEPGKGVRFVLTVPSEGFH